MYEFNYHKPTSLDDIANVLGANEEAKLVAGGMTLIPTLKQRLAKPSDLVDLGAIASLRGITDAGFVRATPVQASTLPIALTPRADRCRGSGTICRPRCGSRARGAGATIAVSRAAPSCWWSRVCCTW